MHGVVMEATMTLHNSANVIGMQAHLKASELKKMFLEIIPNKNWSRNPTSAHVTSFAEGFITEVYKRIYVYIVHYVGNF